MISPLLRDNMWQGRRCRWRHQPRGGYGYIFMVPATIVRITQSRITIDAELARGGTKRVVVKPDSLFEVPSTGAPAPGKEGT